MKKSTLVRMQQHYGELAHINEATDQKLIEIIQSSFSALATSNPDQAISIIEQLQKQKKAIKQLADERHDATEEYVRKMTYKIPDSLEFEDEDSEEEDE